MFEKKCSECGKKIQKDFLYCPYCGNSIKVKRERDNFGMLGRDDEFLERELFQENAKLPMGIDKIMNSLVKQLDKELSQTKGFGNVPAGFKIQISTGKPQTRPVERKEKILRQEFREQIDEKEAERRGKLPRENANSSVRRLADKIIYEIETPGVKDKRDIVITKLENSIEIKAYSKDKCFIKTLPLTVEIIGFYLKEERLFLELKN